MTPTAEELGEILERVRHDERYIRHVEWGLPRDGHPEGTIRAHIAELEANLDRLAPRLSERERAAARLLIHVHDTFKAGAIEGVPITDPRSHASLARAFLAEYCDDADLLAMVQFHDEGYALWLGLRNRGRLDEARLERLAGAIRDWDTFLAFVVVDACTAGKPREPVRWFLKEIGRRATTRVDAGWLL
jgi:hypothetical protein